MNNQAESFVAGPLALVLRLSRILGAAPLRFVKHGNAWRVRLSASSSIYGYTIITIISLVAMWFTTKMDPRASEKMHVKVLKYMETSMVISMVSTMVFSAPSRMRCIISSLNLLQKINSKLNICHWQTPRRRQKITIFVLWGTLIMAGCVLLIDFFIGHSKLCIDVACYVYFVSIIQLCSMQFIMVALHVQSCFKSVNNCLRSLLQDNTMNSSSRCEAIRGIVSAYTLTCKAMSVVNSSHGLVLMLLLSSTFFHSITTSYHFITIFYQENISYASSIQFFWCIHHMFNLMMIIEPCHLTYMEMECTRELVCHLMQRTHSVYDSLVIELEQFCRQLFLNDVSYNPLSIITIERGLLLKILGCLTTYLVVLVDLK